MTGSYTMTFADIKEASKPIKTDRFGNVILPRESRFTSLKGVVWSLVMIGIALTLILQAFRRSPVASTVGSYTLPQDMIALSVVVLDPIFLFLAIQFAYILAVVHPSQNDARTPRFKKMPVQTKFLLIAFEIAILGPFLLANISSLRWEWILSRGQIMIVGLVPWIGVVFALAFFGKIRQRRWWNANIPIQKPFDVLVDEEGVRFTNEYSDQLFRWNHFTQVNETKNLFLLKGLMKAELYILPKRAFTLPIDDQELRTLLINHVPQALLVEQPHGFPVAVAS